MGAGGRSGRIHVWVVDAEPGLPQLVREEAEECYPEHDGRLGQAEPVVVVHVCQIRETPRM